MSKKYFEGFDFTGFWDERDYAKRYMDVPLTDELLVSVEEELGYKLPGAYVALMRMHNGGAPVNTNFPTAEPTMWADDHIAISVINGIGYTKDNSLCGKGGNEHMIVNWEYPDFGVVICGCPSAGHDVVMLDYRKCGKNGEPEVVHVAEDDDYKVTFLAKDFETFIRGLVHDDVYED